MCCANPTRWPPRSPDELPAYRGEGRGIRGGAAAFPCPAPPRGHRCMMVEAVATGDVAPATHKLTVRERLPPNSRAPCSVRYRRRADIRGCVFDVLPYARAMSSVRRIVIAATGALLATGSAFACEPIGYADDKQRLQAALEQLNHATAAIDGVVVKDGGYEVGAVSIVRPTRVWFGPRQAEYRVQKTTMCDADLSRGERIRILLFEAPVSTSLMDRIYRKFSKRTLSYAASGFSDFSWAMQYAVMRKAVWRRAGLQTGGR